MSEAKQVGYAKKGLMGIEKENGRWWGYYRDDMWYKVATAPGRLWYDLVEVEYKDGMILHIPVLMFKSKQEFIAGLIRGNDKVLLRTNSFFHCPACGEPSYYAGLCYDCWHDIDCAERKSIEKMEKGKRARKIYFIGSVVGYEKVPATVKRMTYVMDYNKFTDAMEDKEEVIE